MLHRQRLGRRAEGDRRAVAAPEAAVAGALLAARLGGRLERGQRGVLAERLGGDLVDGRAAQRVVARARLDARQPRRGHRRVGRRRLGGAIAQAADDRHVLAVGLERREDLGQREVAPLPVRRPLAHDRAMGEVEETEQGLRRGRGLRERRARRDHGVQEGQRDADARALEQRPAGQVLLRQVHRLSPT